MTAIEEPLVPGAFTVIVDLLQIRPSMNTINAPVGVFRNGEPFTVFEVYPERDGIIWGRISSNTGGGVSRYVGLRVNNHPKARLELRFENQARVDLGEAIAVLTSSIRELTAELRSRS